MLNIYRGIDVLKGKSAGGSRTVSDPRTAGPGNRAVNGGLLVEIKKESSETPKAAT